MESKRFRFALLVATLLLALFSGFFLVNPWDPLISLVLGILGLIIPGIICLGWYLFWWDVKDQFTFLAKWNAITQVLFGVLLLAQVQPNYWGAIGWIYIIVTLVVVSLSNLKFTSPFLFSLGGFLVLMNVLIPIAFLLFSYDFSLLNGVNELGAMGAIRFYGLQAGSVGVFFAAASQLYWYELEKRRRDDELMERLFDVLDAREERSKIK